ncbi:SOS response-associated peptidase [Paenibacillus sp. S-38]|uniref:SOS response-associated peptidase n=1 Tax=Paenibacillus sp. S-38 TaxID=3416710 RepID=UPI003CE727E9
MCGRFTLTVSPEVILEHFDIAGGLEEYHPRYNVAPGQQVWAVVQDGQASRIRSLKWGLVPFWAKDPKIGYRTFNARSETAAKKAAFREPMKHSRCLIVADGFLEWRTGGGGTKQPVRFRLKSREVYGFAGLWETWRGRDGTELATCTILTTEPNDIVREVHDRMPVILPREAEQAWLDPGVENPADLQQLLRPYPAEEMYAYEVSPLIGNVKNDSADLLEELNSK